MARVPGHGAARRRGRGGRLRLDGATPLVRVGADLGDALHEGSLSVDLVRPRRLDRIGEALAAAAFVGLHVIQPILYSVSYTHLTLPTNREV
eukprot:2876153-Heterocapsa_arctica.AAC.1